MKRIFSLLLALALLSGCGSPAPAEPEVSPDEPLDEEEIFSLPETCPPEPLSAPAVITEGRTPSEDYALPAPSSHVKWNDFQNNMRYWATHPAIEILAQAEDAVFYALPLYANGFGGGALIRWGESLAEFDWTFRPGPNLSPPRMDCSDVDDDGEKELVVVCHLGSGTGVSKEELHILEKNPDGTLTDHAFPENLWHTQLPTLFHAARTQGRTFALLGRELVEVKKEPVVNLEAPTSGAIAHFSMYEWGGLRFQGVFALRYENGELPCYVAETSAEILYENGMFTLQDFHLYSYDQ